MTIFTGRSIRRTSQRIKSCLWVRALEDRTVPTVFTVTNTSDGPVAAAGQLPQVRGEGRDLPHDASWRAADHRSDDWLQPLQHVGVAEAVPGSGRRIGYRRRSTRIIRPVGGHWQSTLQRGTATGAKGEIPASASYAMLGPRRAPMNIPVRDVAAAQKLMIVDCDIHPVQRAKSDLAPFMEEHDTAYGRMRHLRPALEMSETPPRWELPTAPLGSSAPAWA